MTSETEAYSALYRIDFQSFALRAFRELEGALPRPGSHIDLVCHTLARMKAGEHPRMVFNLPPRTLKSFLAAVAFPAWVLGHRPTLKTIIACHNTRLAETHADKIRRLLRSGFYAEAFPGTKLRGDFAARDHFQTEAGGYLIATSLGGGITGEGSDLLIVDDPLDAGKAYSPIERSQANKSFDEKWLSRLNNKATDMLLVVQQRLHPEDLTGFLQKRGGFEHLVVPLIAEEQQTYQLADHVWCRQAGDVLDADNHPPVVIEDLRRNPAVFAAQYQQSPRPDGEALVEAGWFGAIRQPPPTAQRTVLSIDTAMKASGSSYSVCLVFKTDGQNHYLVDVWRKRVDYAQLEAETKRIAEFNKPDMIVIEDAGYGNALKTALEPYAPSKIHMAKPRGSKLERLQGVIDILHAGKVHLPDWSNFNKAFIEEVCAFPGGVSDDQVDALSQYLQAMKEVGPKWLVPKIIASGPRARTPNPMRDPRNISMNYIGGASRRGRF